MLQEQLPLLILLLIVHILLVLVNFSVSGPTIHYGHCSVSCNSSLNVSSNSNLNILNVSGTSYLMVYVYNKIYTLKDVANPNKSIWIDTRGLWNINLQTSGISTVIIDRNYTSIMSSLNVSGTTKKNGATTCISHHWT